MATIYNDEILRVNLENGAIQRSFLGHNLGYGDEDANRFGVQLFRNGVAINLDDCTCNGYFIRSDNATVVIAGTVSGTTAYVILPSSCYAVEGSFSLAIKVSNSSGTTLTTRIIDGTIVRTSTNTYVDPGTILPTIETLIDRIEEAEETIPEDYSALTVVLKLEGKNAETVIPDDIFTVTGILNSDGTGISTYASGNWHTTPYMPIFCRDIYFKGGFFTLGAYNTFCLYDGSQNVLLKAKGDIEVNVADYPNAKYWRASMVTPYTSQTQFYTIIGNKRRIEYITDLIGVFSSGVPTALPDSFYYEQGILSSDGASIQNSSASHHDYYTTPYIELPESSLYFTGGFFPATAYNTFCLYNENKQMIARGTGNQTIALSDYPAAKYFRASSDIYGAKSMFVRISATDPTAVQRTIHVGSGYQFTTLRAGIAEAIKTPNSKVYVHSGTYDLTQEFSSEISAAVAEITGIKLENGIHVVFMSGAYVKALFPTSSAWICTYFSPFYGRDFVLEGLNIEASNCRYCVHDEQAGGDVQYHNVYKNCVMKMTALTSSGSTTQYAQCIGGGLGKYGFIEVDGGHYTSTKDNGSNVPAISYHNGSTAGCDSKLFFRDLYLAGLSFFRFGCHGASTIKSQVYISGCSMGGAISKGFEQSSDTIDNFNIVDWNNTVRS